VTNTQVPTPRDPSRHNSDCVLRLVPASNPFAPQSALTAALHSGAPFGVTMHCWRPETIPAPSGNGGSFGLPVQPTKMVAGTITATHLETLRATQDGNRSEHM
jgi:hypothetical protein